MAALQRVQWSFPSAATMPGTSCWHCLHHMVFLESAHAAANCTDFAEYAGESGAVGGILAPEAGTRVGATGTHAGAGVGSDNIHLARITQTAAARVQRAVFSAAGNALAQHPARRSPWAVGAASA